MDDGYRRDYERDMTDYEREFIEDSQPRLLFQNNTGTTQYLRRRPDFVPVSERLRLHYIDGAHAGLRGEWARLIRDETAVLSAASRRYRRMLRDTPRFITTQEIASMLSGTDQEVF